MRNARAAVALVILVAIAAIWWQQEKRSASATPTSNLQVPELAAKLAPHDAKEKSLAELAEEAVIATQKGELSRAADLHERIAEELGPEAKPEAIEHLGRAIDQRRTLGDFDKQLADLIRRGDLFRQLGDLSAARADFMQTLEQAVRAGNRKYQAEATLNLGLVDLDRNSYATARRAFSDALDLLEGLEGSEEQRIEGLRNLAQAFQYEGDLDEASRILLKARQFQIETGFLHDAAEVLYSLGFIEAIHKNPRGALAYYLEASDFIAGLKPQSRVVFFDRLGAALASLDRPEEAAKALRYSLVLTRDYHLPTLRAGIWNNLCRLSVISPDFPDEGVQSSCETAKPIVLAETKPNRQAGYYLWFSRHLQQQGRSADAIAAGQLAVDRIDMVRASIAGRTGRSRFQDDRSIYFRSLIELELAANESEPAAAHDLQALAVAERLRSRVLLELWSEAGIDLTESADPRLRRELEEKSEELRQLRASSRGTVDELTQAIGQLDILEHRLRESSPDYQRVVRPAPFNLSRIQSALDDETAIVAVVLGESRAQLLLIERHRARSFDLGRREKLEAEAEKYLSLLAEPESTAHRVACYKAGQTVAELLWGAGEERLAGLPTRLVFVGDGKLQQFPIAALPRMGSDQDRPHYLVETHETVHLPALSLLLWERETTQNSEPPSRDAILLGDPLYHLAPRADIRLQPLDPVSLAKYFPAGTSLPPLGRLPSADTEAAAVASQLHFRKLKLVLGPRANRTLAMSSEISEYAIVHLIAHGWKDPDFPELSALLLSEVDENGKSIDGRLTLQDLYRLRLRAELVVASACRTGTDGNLRLEGVGGMAQGFFQAGARRVLFSLWQVESESTALLMGNFYKHLLSGKEPGAALRLASLELIELSKQKRRSWDLPFYWASFIMMGDWSSFSLPSDRNDASPATKHLVSSGVH